MQICFGAWSAFVPLYMFGIIIFDADGADYVGLFSAIVPLMGALSSMPVAWVSRRLGTKVRVA
jgi:hypothetical protein